MPVKAGVMLLVMSTKVFMEPAIRFSSSAPLWKSDGNL